MTFLMKAGCSGKINTACSKLSFLSLLSIVSASCQESLHDARRIEVGSKVQSRTAIG